MHPRIPATLFNIWYPGSYTGTTFCGGGFMDKIDKFVEKFDNDGQTIKKTGTSFMSDPVFMQFAKK